MSKTGKLDDIPGFLRIDNKLATSGQPTAEQLSALGGSGISHVINLALPTSTHAVGDEAARITAQGINYLQLPVLWEAPTFEQFSRFAQLLWVIREESVLVHCAMNKRVSVFVFLYRVLYEALPVDEAAEQMHRIWQPDVIWLAFIQSVLGPRGEVYLPPATELR
jgi:protein tyrosine phosphatase (PTP) superfamily phosphohydrolase (DUF442 family)